MIVKRTVVCKFTGADASATAGGTITFGRPGILRAIKVTSPGQAAGMDGTLKDDNGNTLITFTNIGNSTIFGPITSDGITDDGATAADKGTGHPFRTGLVFAFTSGDGDIGSLTDDAAAICTVWVEV